jgi:hypothetical protein
MSERLLPLGMVSLRNPKSGRPLDEVAKTRSAVTVVSDRSGLRVGARFSDHAFSLGPSASAKLGWGAKFHGLRHVLDLTSATHASLGSCLWTPNRTDGTARFGGGRRQAVASGKRKIRVRKCLKYCSPGRN